MEPLKAVGSFWLERIPWKDSAWLRIPSKAKARAAANRIQMDVRQDHISAAVAVVADPDAEQSWPDVAPEIWCHEQTADERPVKAQMVMNQAPKGKDGVKWEMTDRWLKKRRMREWTKAKKSNESNFDPFDRSGFSVLFSFPAGVAFYLLARAFSAGQGHRTHCALWPRYRLNLQIARNSFIHPSQQTPRSPNRRNISFEMAPRTAPF